MASLEHILITGASQGIGRSIALEFARLHTNAKLTLVARDSTKLNEVKTELEIKFPGVSVNIQALDLLEASAPGLLAETYPDVTILVNNAGEGFFGEFTESSLSHQVQSISLNCARPLELCYHFAKHMKQRRHGLIVNISSMAAFLPCPYFSVYGGTKAFLYNFGAALDSELSVFGVRLMSVCPGGVKTQFHLKAGLSHSIVEKFESALMSPEAIAKEVVAHLDKPKTLLVPGKSNRFSLFLLRFLPLNWPIKLMGRLYREQLKR